ncbi:hypothetical protein ACQEU3_20790 [Spirillospora sp. CA-253888]
MFLKYAKTSRNTLRPADQPERPDGGNGFLLHYLCPRGLRNFADERTYYLPTVTINGENTPASWGSWLYSAAPGEKNVKAVQGGSPETETKFAHPVPVTARTTVIGGTFSHLEYFPQVRYSPDTTRDGRSTRAPIPIMREHVSIWRRSVQLRGFVYSSVLVLAVAAVILLEAAINGS